VPRGDDWHRHGLLERRPATTAMVEHEFEHAVSVGNAERGTVQTEFSGHGEERGADMWVEHSKLDLEIVQSRVGRPSALGVVPGDARLEGLWSSQEITDLVHRQRITYNILVDSIMFPGGSLIYEVMSRAVDAEHKTFLERPSSDIKRKLLISRFRAAENKKS